MDPSNNKPLEFLLKESLIVSPLYNERNLERCFSEQKNPQNFPKSKNQIKQSQSVHRKGSNLVKYPIKNIPFGLEEQNPSSKNQSTLDFLDRLKQIDKRTENDDFLEETNQEIKIAFQQLQEIQKLIAQKMSEKERKERGEEDEETKQKRSVISRFSKQFERMQREYLNKTRIRFKSLKDFENVTMAENKTTNEEAKFTREKEKEVEVLYKKNKVLPGTSSQNFPENIQKRSTSDSILKKHVFRGNKSEKEDLDQRKKKVKRFNFEGKTSKQILFEHIMPLLRSRQHIKNPMNERDQVKKIRYLLKPEHCSGNTGTKNEATQSDSLEAEVKENEKTRHVSSLLKTKPKPKRRVRFIDSKAEHSVLKFNDLFFSSEEGSDFQEESVSSKSDIVEDSGNSWKTVQQKTLEKEMEQYNEEREREKERRKLFKYDFSTNIMEELEELEPSSESVMRGREMQSQTKNRRKIGEKPKVDESVSTSDNKYANGRKKLNLLLHGREKLTKELESPDLADSVLKSSFLSKEFIGDKPFQFSNRGKAEEESMELLESVIHKFGIQPRSFQLANSGEGRDQKLYTTLSTALKDTLYTEIQK